MIDFLFLMLALFATLAMSRAALFDSEIDLVKLKAEKSKVPKTQFQTIHLSITAEGKYKWLTEFQEYPMESTLSIQQELTRQFNQGALPQNKSQTEVLLHIDKNAPWSKIAEVLFAIREIGFSARPVYENN